MQIRSETTWWKQTYFVAKNRVINTTEYSRSIRNGTLERRFRSEVKLDGLGQELWMRGQRSDFRCCLFGSVNVDVGDHNPGGPLFGKGVAAGFPYATCYESIRRQTRWYCRYMGRSIHLLQSQRHNR